MTRLPPAAAYRLWAPVYEPETAVTFLENRLVERLGRSPVGARLLDVGCGTGRRLRGVGAALAVGVDLTPEMIAAGMGGRGDGGRAGRATGEPRPGQVGELGANEGPNDSRAAPPSLEPAMVAADARALPFTAGAFDLVWCRLMIGHLADPGAAYGEMARVCRPGGAVLVTDVHPTATAAGHRRTFRDADGRLREVEHHLHPLQSHIDSAAAAGLDLLGASEGQVGADIRPFYRAANRLGAYEDQLGLPLVLALEFRRRGEA